MFEIRWLQQDTGKTAMNEWGYYEPVVIRVLQFRYKYQRVAYGYNPGIIASQDNYETVWSDWTDVPVVVTSKEK